MPNAAWETLVSHEAIMPDNLPFDPDPYRTRRRELIAGFIIYGALLVLAFSL